ncbi:unnamed protein product [Citrullus colocynthis]|uniref:Uncharacterized protein n=1 Tax=Citrullus colocynthis TaxID=252529 RepID=A0ABP0Z554_9ROSI
MPSPSTKHPQETMTADGSRSDHVKEEIKEYMSKKKDIKEQRNLIVDIDVEDYGIEDQDENDVGVSAAGAKEPLYYSRARTSRASTSSSTQPTPTQVNLDDYEAEEEDTDGYKSNDGVNEDENQFSDDEFDL